MPRSSKDRTHARQMLEDLYRCQFCNEETPVSQWGDGGKRCPACRKVYDPMLAQEGDD